ncbi:MAG: SAM-dependent methyltransferase [Bacilli bacterium]|nr:SAM-dependent methyltransferase [Bacilli bacterium]
MSIESVLLFAQRKVEACLKLGDIAIDATVGQGKDTLLLARLVGEQGTVYGFDIQKEAIAIAQKKLNETLDYNGSIRWIERSHAYIKEELPSESQGHVGAVMFNLGYLPGFDHMLVTKPASTIAGLEAAVQLLRQGGIITIVVYTGHQGAHEEADAVQQWAANLPQKQFDVLSYHFINQKNHPPFLIIVEKK